MKEKILVLKSDILAEQEALERLFAELRNLGAQVMDPKDVIVAGYHLHNLYNAFENIFRRVAETFENHIPDPSRWHALLLERMARDIEGVRPRLISQASLDMLDELRRFRHVFRSVYRHTLDMEGVNRVLSKVHQLEEIYKADLGRFLAFLGSLVE